MRVLIDTTIWSLALRRKPETLSVEERLLVEEWCTLVQNGAAVLIGPIRQEVLTGIKDPGAFRGVQAQLHGMDLLPIEADDYDRAAEFFNTCRTRGIAGGDIDLLICSIASSNDIPIFTTDRDFDRYADHLPIEFYRP